METISHFRVIEDRGTSYLVASLDGHVRRAEISGTLRKSDSLDWPTVGDWVKGSLQPGDWLYIESVEPRSKLLLRQASGSQSPQKLGANVDHLMIATALNQDFNLNRLDRYVAMALGCQVQPVILLTKMDLTPNPQSYVDEVGLRFPNINVHPVSAFQNSNLESLQNYLMPNQTIAFMGSSGVGKSTLMNALLGASVLATGSIREGDGKGRHTTTHRSLHRTANGAWLMDTPGLRTLALWEGDEGITSLFQDIEELARNCRFRDCRHQNEPGCQVRKALETGDLSESRWQNYLKLQSEEAHQRRKVSKVEASNAKKIWKKRSQEGRESYQRKRHFSKNEKW